MRSPAAPSEPGRRAPVEHVHEWVAAGLISDEQADAIAAWEVDHESGTPAEAGGGLTVVTEIAGYLAGLVALAGGIAIVAPRWEDLAVGGRLLVAAAVAVVGLLAGSVLMRPEDVRTNRLGGLIWAVATGGAALAAGVLVDELDLRDDAWTGVAVGVTVAAVGGALWRNRDRPFQLATTGVGVAIAVGALAELTDVTAWVTAPVGWVLSAAFGAGVLVGSIRPRLVGLAVAAIGLMMSSFLLADADEHVAALVAVATAAAIVAVAVRDRAWPIVGIGLVAFLAAMSMLLGTVLHALVGQVIAVVVALAVIGAVVRFARTE